MLGATKAAEAMAKRWQEEDRAKGRAEARKEFCALLEQIDDRGLSPAEAMQFIDEFFAATDGADSAGTVASGLVGWRRRRAYLVRLIRKAGIM